MRAFTLSGILIAIGGVSTPFVMLWFRHRALRDPVAAHRKITEDERESLRRRGRFSVVTFVGVWVISLGLIGRIDARRIAVEPSRRARRHTRDGGGNRMATPELALSSLRLSSRLSACSRGPGPMRNVAA
jgi:hypothetical protein